MLTELKDTYTKIEYQATSFIDTRLELTIHDKLSLVRFQIDDEFWSLVLEEEQRYAF